jgi:hypothetical protein
MTGTGIYAAIIARRFELICKRLELACDTAPLDTTRFRVPASARKQMGLFD